MKGFTLFTLSISILFAAALSAQPIWLEQRQGTSLAVEFLKPYFVDSNSSFATSVLFLSGRLSVSQTITIAADLPLAHHGYRDDFGLAGFESSTVMGNPYLGLEIRKRAFPVFAELGLRLPLGTDRDMFYDESRATELGMFTDPDRFEAFKLYDLTVMARLNYLRELHPGFLLHLRGGWSGGGSAEQDYGPGGFQTLDYSVQLRHQIEQVSIVGGVTGRYLLDGYTFHLHRFGERGRFAHQVAVAASIGFGRVRPGILFRVPIDEVLNDKIRFVLGLSLGIQLK